MQELDPRIVIVGIEVSGRLKTYEGLAIVASGTKFANANQNECEIKILNLDGPTRAYILTETSPYNLNRTPKIFTLDAGRKSYGTTRIFSGNISSSTSAQPSDIPITLKCLAGNYLKGEVISRSQGPRATLSDISKQIASDLGVTLDFQATEKQIANYVFSGAALKQIEHLGSTGGVDVFLDDAVLVVKDLNVPLTNRLKIVNMSSGMVGVPEITEQGVKVKFLLDNQTTLGGALRVESVINPAANGDYTIYKLGFEIASRDTPFYWTAEAKRA